MILHQSEQQLFPESDELAFLREFSNLFLSAFEFLVQRLSFVPNPGGEELGYEKDTLKGDVAQVSSTTRFFLPLLAERVIMPFLADLGGVESCLADNWPASRAPSLTCIVDRRLAVQTPSKR